MLLLALHSPFSVIRGHQLTMTPTKRSSRTPLCAGPTYHTPGQKPAKRVFEPLVFALAHMYPNLISNAALGTSFSILCDPWPPAGSNAN